LHALTPPLTVKALYRKYVCPLAWLFSETIRRILTKFILWVYVKCLWA